jgi:hypothetical protein
VVRAEDDRTAVVRHLHRPEDEALAGQLVVARPRQRRPVQPERDAGAARRDDPFLVDETSAGRVGQAVDARPERRGEHDDGRRAGWARTGCARIGPARVGPAGRDPRSVVGSRRLGEPLERAV